jgi:hypothetical protein
VITDYRESISWTEMAIMNKLNHLLTRLVIAQADVANAMACPFRVYIKSDRDRATSPHSLAKVEIDPVCVNAPISQCSGHDQLTILQEVHINSQRIFQLSGAEIKNFLYKLGADDPVAEQ